VATENKARNYVLAKVSSQKLIFISLAILGIVSALLLVAQAYSIAHFISLTFIHHDKVKIAYPYLLVFLTSSLIYVLTQFELRKLSLIGAHRLTRSIREDATSSLLSLNPLKMAELSVGGTTEILSKQIEAIAPFFSRYLIQLIQAITIPAVIIAWVLPHDILSGVIFIATIPFIPIFMYLVGKAAELRAKKQWQRFQILSGYFMDLIMGLPTLKALGKSQEQQDKIVSASKEYKRSVLDTLKIAFLSALILELFASLSIALIAVAVGLRLLYGQISFSTALAILILAPEIYIPLRKLGSGFHDSLNAIAATAKIVELNQLANSNTTLRHASYVNYPTSKVRQISLEKLYISVDHTSKIVGPFDLDIREGDKVCIFGASGAGKTTLINTILGWRRPYAGKIIYNDLNWEDVDFRILLKQIAYVPQKFYIPATTIEDYIKLFAPYASTDDIEAALKAVDLQFPPSYFTGENGLLLSAGQKQRLVLVRAILQPQGVMVLDEPVANLDFAAQAHIAGLLKTSQKTIIFATHSEILKGAANKCLMVG